MDWFKVQAGLLTSRKFQEGLTDTMKVRLLNLWCLTAKYDGTLPKIPDMAYEMRLTESEMQSTVDHLVEKEFMDATEYGYLPHDWDQHNPPITSRQRVRKHRQAAKQSETLRPVSVKRDETLHALHAVSDETPRESRGERGERETPPQKLTSGTLHAAFERCMELHPNADPDAAGRVFVSLTGNGTITEADAALMEPGMNRWLRSELWAPGQGKFNPEWKRYSVWLREKAWLSHPAPSAEAAAQDRNQREGYWTPPKEMEGTQ